jgi:16S rRNA C1402 (ribose-2'-O) methylase RsmI
MNSKDYAKTFQLKKANMKKIFYLFSEGKKQAKRILKDYNIKNEIFYISRNLTNEQQNISRAMFIIKEKRVVSQYIPDFSFER